MEEFKDVTACNFALLNRLCAFQSGILEY